MIDLSLAKPGEIVKLLGSRLRKERLAQQMTQADVAERSGISVNTLSNLENGHNTALDNLIRVAVVLGRRKEIEELFKPKLESLDDIMRYENTAKRHRIKRKSNSD